MGNLGTEAFFGLESFSDNPCHGFSCLLGFFLPGYEEAATTKETKGTFLSLEEERDLLLFKSSANVLLYQCSFTRPERHQLLADDG